MDEMGWVNVKDLLKKLNITMSDLESIVENNNKQRFSFNENKEMIRANQGHSFGLAPKLNLIKVNEDTIQKAELYLYHGTSLDTWNIIKESSIKPMSRNHVHWTSDIFLAQKRSEQKGGTNGVIITLKCKQFTDDGHEIHLSDNNVFLTEEVNNKYLSLEK